MLKSQASSGGKLEACVDGLRRDKDNETLCEGIVSYDDDEVYEEMDLDVGVVLGHVRVVAQARAEADDRSCSLLTIGALHNQGQVAGRHAAIQPAQQHAQSHGAQLAESQDQRSRYNLALQHYVGLHRCFILSGDHDTAALLESLRWTIDAMAPMEI